MTTPFDPLAGLRPAPPAEAGSRAAIGVLLMLNVWRAGLGNDELHSLLMEPLEDLRDAIHGLHERQRIERRGRGKAAVWRLTQTDHFAHMTTRDAQRSATAWALTHAIEARP